LENDIHTEHVEIYKNESGKVQTVTLKMDGEIINIFTLMDGDTISVPKRVVNFGFKYTVEAKP